MREERVLVYPDRERGWERERERELAGVFRMVGQTVYVRYSCESS